MGKTDFLRYEGNSDQWEVNDFTLIAFVESSSWCWVGKPDNGTSLFRQHLNILQDKNNKHHPITMDAKDQQWHNAKFNESLS